MPYNGSGTDDNDDTPPDGIRLRRSPAGIFLVRLADIHRALDRDLREAADLCDAVDGGAQYAAVVRSIAREVRRFGDASHDYGRKLESMVPPLLQGDGE